MNQEVKRKIIETAAGCFLKYGIKSTSMSFISEVLRISKRTLYQFFPSKRELLEACVSYRIEKSRRLIEEKFDILGCLEAIVYLNYEAYALSEMIYPAFRKDIVNYVGALALFEDEYRAPLYRMCADLFDEAKREKLIQSESNFELAFLFFENTLFSASTDFRDEGGQAVTYSNAILTYLAGICTNEGRKQLKNISIKIQYEEKSI